MDREGVRSYKRRPKDSRPFQELGLTKGDLCLQRINQMFKCAWWCNLDVHMVLRAWFMLQRNQYNKFCLSLSSYE